MAPQRFAIIGAGVAGLQAASQLQHAGFRVTIFEKSGDVGGVWQSNYTGFRLQVRKWHYEIPGYPWPNSESDPKYPSGAEVQAYLQHYARDAGLLPHIRFHVAVQSLKPVGGSPVGANANQPQVEAAGTHGWEVEWTDESGTLQSEVFDFVVVATGLFNQPERPDWAQGLVRESPPEEGSGAGPWVVDAKDFTDASVAKGKRVVVVGAGKTAHDVGVAVSGVASSTTLVARRGHWMAPQTVLGFIPFEFASYTRWAWALQPAWYDAGALKKGTHAFFYPLKTAIWGLFGLLFPLHTSTPSQIKPKHGLLEGIYDTIGIIDSKQLARAFKSGRLAARAARVTGISGNTVELDDGSALEADIVVLATGYRATARQLFPEAVQADAGYKGDQQWLYRNVLPPELSNVAFIGQNATFQHVLTTALQSRWLVDVLTGKLKLPPKAEQLEDLAKQEIWLAKFNGVNRANNFVWAQHGKYHDVLVKDIRGSTNAYPRWNLPGELFGYIKNQLYAPLFPGNQGLRSKRSAGAAAPTSSTNGKTASNGVDVGANGSAVAVH